MKKIIEKARENHAVHIQEAGSEMERERLWIARRSAYGVFAKYAKLWERHLDRRLGSDPLLHGNEPQSAADHDAPDTEKKDD